MQHRTNQQHAYATYIFCEKALSVIKVFIKTKMSNDLFDIKKTLSWG